MIYWTVEQATELVKDLVEDGICNRSDPRVLKRLNEAVRMLIIESDWKGTLRALKLCISECCITMPRDVEAVREVYADCRVGRVEPIWYEWLEHGPGELKNCCSNPCTKALVDMGITPTHAEPKNCWPLLVVTDCADDKDVTVTIRGLDCSGLEIFDCGSATYSPGVELETNNDCPRFSDKCYSRITSVKKSKISKGYIRVFSYNPAKYQYQQLTVIHPADISPAYRRYKMPGKNSGYAGLLVKTTANELVHDSDILPIQNVDAIRSMLRAIRAEDAGKPGDARYYKGEATRLLGLEKKNFDGDQATRLQVDGSTFALGDIGLDKRGGGRY